MKKIAVLDKNTIDKIAAGEVVERPSSVVKELVENAIDAGSTAITVEIKDGGVRFIRITDNGQGIDKDQIPVAFMRHATSKIQRVEDLHEISSLGFRGEALSSIAAVSQVELITKTPADFMGTRYIIEGGIEKGIESIGAPEGTTFLVRNLFFNTPARSKFLKTPTTEAGYINNFIEQLALSHPEISFQYIVNGQNKLHTSGNHMRKDVIYSIYGRDITKELIELDFSQTDIKVHGYIGKPLIARGNRNYENYYVNGRYVKSKIIANAIEAAYKPFMMQHKYPFTCICLDINPETIDINVHPTKMEIRFSDGELIYQAIYQAATKALTHWELIPDVSLLPKQSKDIPEKAKTTVLPQPFESNRRQTEAATVQIQPSAKRSSIEPAFIAAKPVLSAKTDIGGKPVLAEKADAYKNTIRETPVTYGKQENMFTDSLLSKEAKAYHRIIGQLFDTYWLVEYDGKLFIIDQHAAHEKVLYERLVKKIKNDQITSQMISPPTIISVSMQEAGLIEKYMDVFTKFGFEITSFGGKEFSISAVPDNLSSLWNGDLFLELLDHLDEEKMEKPLELVLDRIATMACKAAVKGNNHLSETEAGALIDELLELENPYNCPHGRPTIIAMSKYELERKFKRII